MTAKYSIDVPGSLGRVIMACQAASAAGPFPDDEIKTDAGRIAAVAAILGMAEQKGGVSTDDLSDFIGFIDNGGSIQTIIKVGWSKELKILS